MSKYTTELRYICESLAGLSESKGYDDIENILDNSYSKIFSFTYPIYDENHRAELEKKILRHYYTREIGEETYGLWKLRLQNRMVEIMPYFNQLYESEEIEFNPMLDYAYNKEYNSNEKRDGSKAGNNNTNTDQTQKTNTNLVDKTTEKNLYSDTPQGALTGVDDEEYLTNARKIQNDRNADSSTNGDINTTNVNKYDESTSDNNTQEGTEKVTGKLGGKSYSQLLTEYRKTILNIDLQVIDALSDLFIKLW